MAISPAADASILIPTHNRSAILERTLRSLVQIEMPADLSAELVIVANACTDDTVAMVDRLATELPMPVRCVEESQPGVGYARNRCVAEARADLLLFVDDDVDFDTHWLGATHRGLMEEKADIVGGRVLLDWSDVERPDWWSPPLTNLLSGLDMGDEPTTDSAAFMPYGANLAFHRRVFDAVGPFPVELGRKGESGLMSGEETYFVRSAIAEGFGLRYLPESIVHHRVPMKRVTPAYILGVAYGNGYCSILLKDRMPFFSALSRVFSRCSHLVSHGFRWLWARFRGRGDVQMAEAARCADAWGGVRAATARMFGQARSPRQVA